MQAAAISLTATLTETAEIATDIRLMRFDVPFGALNLEAGAHVTFKLPKGEGSIERSYSVVDDGTTPGKLTIAVKLEPQSKGGSKHMWSLRPGDTLKIIGNGNAMPPAYTASDFIVLAGGIGVTPMTGMVRALQQTGKPLRMIYCARSPEQAAFHDMFSALLGGALTTHLESDDSFLDIPALLDSISPETMLFMCGPAGLMQAVKRGWEDRDLPVHNLRYETFANSGTQPTTAFKVTVAETGKTVRVAEDESLLDALLASGHDVLNDCRKGECGLCKLHVTDASGDIDHRDVFLSTSERASNASLCACVSRLNGGHMTVEIDGITHGRSL